MEKLNNIPLIKKIVIVIALAISSAVLFNQLLALSGLVEASEEYKVASESIYSKDTLLLYLYSGLMIPIIEELVFRNCIFGGLMKLGKHMLTKDEVCFFFAANISSILFGLYHMNLVQLLYGYIMGLIMCMVFKYLLGLFGSMLFHVTANCFVIANKGVRFYMTKPGMIISIVASLIVLLITIVYMIIFCREQICAES